MLNRARMQSTATGWAILVTLGMTLSARGDYVSQTFQFDRSDSLPSGPLFGSVTIDAYDGVGAPGGGLSPGQVRMSFQAAPLPIYGPINSSFGFAEVGFNTNLPLTAGQIHTPAGWNLRNSSVMGGFGQFGWQAYGDPSLVSSPAAVVTISGLGANATLDHFLIPSTSATDASVYFAGLIGGFTLNTDGFNLSSHLVGVTAPTPPWDSGVTPNPEPSALLLGLCGVWIVGLRRWWKGF